MSAMYRLEGEDAAGRRRRGVPRMERLHGAICPERQQVRTARPSTAIWSPRLMVEVLKNCGDDLSRENIMKQARSLKGLQLPMMVPGIQINTSP